MAGLGKTNQMNLLVEYMEYRVWYKSLFDNDSYIPYSIFLVMYHTLPFKEGYWGQ